MILFRGSLFRRAVYGGAALLMLVAPVSARAQSPVRWTPRLQLDNDFYNLWVHYTRRPDEQYTNGMRASLEAMDGAWWGHRVAPRTPDCQQAAAGRACRSTMLTLGQDLYTPNLDRAPFTVPDWERERPYFAWLYLTAAGRVSAPRSLRQLAVSVGVTGPPAGGRAAQDLAHRFGYADLATGWETQISFEPGLSLEWQHAGLAWRRSSGRAWGVDVAPHYAMSAGNIRTRAEAGGTARLGWNLSHPWSPAEWRDRAAREVWLSVSGSAMGIAHDMSLDGSLFRPAHRVARVPAVPRYEIGMGVRWQAAVLEYRAVTRGREYRTGPAQHSYSSVTLLLARAAR